jgi:phosphoglycerate dehydrogenase-like enzyme
LTSFGRLRWVHSRSAGLDKSLLPELTESSVVLTNMSGVFSASLGEFALASILYFAKDFRRMIRSQTAGVWEPFDVLPVEGYTTGIVGYGDIGRTVASRVRAMGMKVLTVKRHVSHAGNGDSMVEEIFGSDRRLEMLSR